MILLLVELGKLLEQKKSAKGSLVYCELKKLKPWFHEVCSEL
jgi:hypothetical protein